jgi:hypothetical protein
MKPLLCDQPDEFAFELTGKKGELQTALGGHLLFQNGRWTAEIVFQTVPRISVTVTAALKHEALAEALRRALLQQYDPSPAKETLQKAP